MKLNQKQQAILKAIKKNCQSDQDIAKELKIDISVYRYHIDKLKEEKYVKPITWVASGNLDGKFNLHPYYREVPSVYLTDKGKVAIDYPNDLITEEQPNMNSINFNAPINASIGVLQNSDGNTVNITQNNNQNIQEIINSLEFLEKEIQVFPEEEKQDALVYLDQLKTEIKGDQNPAKIRAFFKGFMKIVIPLASLIVNGADFANNATDLATKLVTYFNVDISHIALPFQ